MADRIVVMHDGVVEQIGAPLDLYDRPDNLFVAGFIGSPAMNFIPGRLRANGTSTFVADGGVVRARRSPSPPAGAAGRPSDPGRAAGAFHAWPPGGMPVEVVVVEPTGSETLLSVKAGAKELLCLFRERVLPKPGETITIKPDPALVHLFDAETFSAGSGSAPDLFVIRRKPPATEIAEQQGRPSQ